MREEVIISGQEVTVTKPDRLGIPTEVRIPTDSVVVTVGGEIVSVTKRREFGTDEALNGEQARDRRVNALGYSSGWGSLHNSPTKRSGNRSRLIG